MMQNPWDNDPIIQPFTPPQQDPYGRQIYRQGPPQPTPQTPDQERKGRVEADLAARTAADTAAKIRAERITAERNARAPTAAETERIAVEAKNRKENLAQLADLRTVAQQLNRVQELYHKDVKGVDLLSPLEYLPTPKMRRFRAQSKALAILMKPLIRGPGEGTWTDADQKLLETLVPAQNEPDADNEERIAAAKRFLATKAEKYGGRVRLYPAGGDVDPGLPSGWSVEEE